MEEEADGELLGLAGGDELGLRESDADGEALGLAVGLADGLADGRRGRWRNKSE